MKGKSEKASLREEHKLSLKLWGKDISIQGLPWWSSIYDSTLPMQSSQVQSLLRELDQLRPGAANFFFFKYQHKGGWEEREPSGQAFQSSQSKLHGDPEGVLRAASTLLSFSECCGWQCRLSRQLSWELAGRRNGGSWLWFKERKRDGGRMCHGKSKALVTRVHTWTQPTS